MSKKQILQFAAIFFLGLALFAAGKYSKAAKRKALSESFVWNGEPYDIGEVNSPEPYSKRSAQGMILGADGEKMSKSRGNVVDPLDIVNQYGADTLRVYVLFMGDYGSAAPWNDSSVKGCRRFLERVAGITDLISEDKKTASYETLLHKTIKKVTDDIEAQKFNTAIAALMTLINEIYKEGSITKENLVIFLKLLSPFAPHIAEEIYELIGGEGFLTVSEWPEFDEALCKEDVIEIGVQVNGKVRGAVGLTDEDTQDTALEKAKEIPSVAKAIADKNIVKVIYVKGKILNLIVK
jgi:leucyl-tRNA synthetase